MTSSAGADGDMPLPPAHTTARPSRSPQVASFNYESRPTAQSELLEGLGIVGRKEQKNSMDKLTDLVKKFHPHWNSETETFTQTRLKGDARAKVCNELYEAMPNFCDAPPEYRVFALGKILTAVVSFRITKRGPKGGTESKDPPLVQTKSRRAQEDGMSESDTNHKQKRPRYRERTPPIIDDDRSRAGSYPRRSVSRVTPMIDYSRPFRGPDLRESVILFHSVKDGKLDKKLVKLRPDDVRSHEHAIDWSLLVQEAFVADDEGFRFDKRLYLSPRPDQDLPIRTQATLSSALQDMKTGNLIFTTVPVDPDVKMEDALFSTNPIPRQRHPADVSGLSGSQSTIMDLRASYHPGTAIQTEPADDPLLTSKPQLAGNLQPDNLQPDNSQPDNLQPDNSQPDNLQPDNLQPDNSQPDNLQPDNLQPDNSQPDNLQPDNLQPDNSQPDNSQLADYPRPTLTPINSPINKVRYAGSHQPSASAPQELAVSTKSPVRKRRRNVVDSDTKSNEDDDNEDHDDDDKRESARVTSPAQPSVSPPPNAPGLKDFNFDADDDELTNPSDADDEAVLVGAEDDNEARNEQAAMEATRYALSRPETKTAYAKALKEDQDVWNRAGTTLLVDIANLQSPEVYPHNRIPLKASVGLNSRYGLYAHQITGAVEMFNNVFGPRRSMIQGDEMGYGKTSMVMTVWDMNFRAVAQTHGAKVAASTPADRNPLLWPVLEAGKLNGCDPRVGALFISASPNGIEVWVKTFYQMFCGDAAHTRFEAAWRPKLVILHSDGPKLAQTYGGAVNGIFSAMDHSQWAELLPLPDWSRARPAFGEPYFLPERATGEVEPTRWAPHPKATATQPSPTSTRVIIVSTNQSWKTNVGNILTNDDCDKEMKALATQARRLALSKQVPAHLKIMAKISVLKKAKQEKTPGMVTDGTQPMQATRKQRYWTSGTLKGKRWVEEVVDLRYASWIVVDELHSAASADTITYRQIIDPTIVGCGPGRAPGVLGITGTAMHNGAGLVMTFAQKVCLRVGDGASNDPGVNALLSVKDVDFDAAWKSVQDVYLKANLSPPERVKKLQSLPNVTSFHTAFATMVEFYLIARDSNSQDPWGKLLTILHVKLNVRYVNVHHRPDMWEKVKQAQCDVQALQKSMYGELVADWKQRGSVPDQEPTMPTLAKSNPNAYLVARTVSCLPNVLVAIHNWQLAHPNEDAGFGDPSSICLGGGNKYVQKALKSNDSIRQSFIWDIAQEACQGSKKVELVVAEITQLSQQTTEASVTTQAGRQTVQYQSKFVVAVGTRFVRALLWAYLCQHFGEARVVGVADKKTRVTELPPWQRYWDPVTEQLDDGVNILVAGMKVISQSVTLIEGHVLYGFDPPSNNNDNEQYPKRQHRIGQQHDCRVVWLVTTDPAHKSKKADPDAQSMKTIESTIVMRNKGKSDFFADMRNIQATAADECVDLTRDTESESGDEV